MHLIVLCSRTPVFSILGADIASFMRPYEQPAAKKQRPADGPALAAAGVCGDGSETPATRPTQAGKHGEGKHSTGRGVPAAEPRYARQI